MDHRLLSAMLLAPLYSPRPRLVSFAPSRFRPRELLTDPAQRHSLKCSLLTGTDSALARRVVTTDLLTCPLGPNSGTGHSRTNHATVSSTGSVTAHPAPLDSALSTSFIQPCACAARRSTPVHALVRRRSDRVRTPSEPHGERSRLAFAELC